MNPKFLGGLAIALAGCASAPTDISFTTVDAAIAAENPASASDRAMLVMAVGPIGRGGSFRLQRLNADRTDFEGDPVGLSFASASTSNDSMKRPSPDVSGAEADEVNFLIKEVDPGLYAATFAVWYTGGVVHTGDEQNPFYKSASLCRDTGAATFEVKAGQISILSSRDAFPPGVMSLLTVASTADDVAAQFALTRANYPNLVGEPIYVTPELETRWTEQQRGFFNSQCRYAEPGSLTVTRFDLEAADPVSGSF